MRCLATGAYHQNLASGRMYLLLNLTFEPVATAVQAGILACDGYDVYSDRTAGYWGWATGGTLLPKFGSPSVALPSLHMTR